MRIIIVIIALITVSSPGHSIGDFNEEDTLLSPPKILKKYLPDKLPFIGIINIITKKITLFPTFKDKLILHIEGSLNKPLKDYKYIEGIYHGASEGEEAKKLSPLKLEEINNTRESGYLFPARQIFSYDENDPENKKFGLVAHKYLIKLINVREEDINKYRGFSYQWDNIAQAYKTIYQSGSLNNGELSDIEKLLIDEEMTKILDQVKETGPR